MKADRGRGGERDGGVFYGFSARVIHHRIHYICEFRWTCIDDLFCFLRTLARCGSSGVGPSCPGGFAVAGGTSLSPLLLSNVSLLLGSVRLRRMLPPTDCTGLRGASVTGDSSSLGIPSVRIPCTAELKNGLNILPRIFPRKECDDLLACLSVVVLLRMILGGRALPMSFQLPPFVSSSEDKITSSSLPANPGLVVGGGGMSSMNQSWCAIRNSNTS